MASAQPASVRPGRQFAAQPDDRNLLLRQQRFLSERTLNTVAGNSFPEVFAGGPDAFVWKPPIVGWQVAPGQVRTDRAANPKADLAAIFAIEPTAPAAYQGRGNLAAAS